MATWVTKIKISDEPHRIRIEYAKGIEFEDADEYMISSKEKGEPGLYAALQDLKEDVLEMCELPEEYGETMLISSVSFSHANDIMGATITASKTLKMSQSPLILNTPHKPSMPYSETGDESVCLGADAITRIESLIRFAKRYIDGEREQLELIPNEPAAATA